MSVYPVQSDQGFTPAPAIIPTLRPQLSEEVKPVAGVSGKNDSDADDKKVVATPTPVGPTTNSQGQVIGTIINIAV